MTEEEKKKSGGVSRREFLKDAGLLVGGTAIGSTVLLAACGGETVPETLTTTQTITKTVTVDKTIEVPVVPPGLITLNVNGKTRKIYVEPNCTLSEALREKLGLTGTKLGCGMGACGACTVLMDNKVTLSCLTLAIECNGKDITTVEGLSENEKLGPIQEAFMENNVMQCGYCTPGQLITAEALLQKNPNPTEEEVKAALSGVICRCGTYFRVTKAVMEAAGMSGG